VGYQLAGILAIGGWSFIVSYIILKAMDKIPWIGLRVPPEHESIGTDLALMGELAYRYETRYDNVQKRPTLAQITPLPDTVEMQTIKPQPMSGSIPLSTDPLVQNRDDGKSTAVPKES